MYLVIFMLAAWVQIITGQLTHDDMTSFMKRFSELEAEVKRQKEEIVSLREAKTCQCQHVPENLANPKRFVLNEGPSSEGPLAFTAAIAPLTLDHVQANQIIKFETVITDIGGGYNNASGVFVVRVPGIYVFSCSLLDHWGIETAPGQEHGSAMLHAEIIQNQKILGRIFAHAEKSYRDQGAQTVFTYADIGDQIFIRNIDNNDLGLGGQYYSTFSGYLLYPM